MTINCNNLYGSVSGYVPEMIKSFSRMSCEQFNKFPRDTVKKAGNVFVEASQGVVALSALLFAYSEAKRAYKCLKKGRIADCLLATLQGTIAATGGIAIGYSVVPSLYNKIPTP